MGLAIGRQVSPKFAITAGLILGVCGFALVAFAGSSADLLPASAGLAVVALGDRPPVALGTGMVVGSVAPERAGSATSTSERAWSWARRSAWRCSTPSPRSSAGHGSRWRPASTWSGRGSKEKLFAAAAHFDLRLPDFAQLPLDDAGTLLARHVLARWSGDETLFALLRAGVTNATAAERMRSIFSDQLGPQVAKVCPDPAEAPLRAGLISSQVLGLALCRFVLRLPPVAEMTEDEAVGWLGPTLQRYLVGY